MQDPPDPSRNLISLTVLAALLVASGCASKPQHLPAPPTLYTTGTGILVEAAEGPENNEIELLYATDRKPDPDLQEGRQRYTNERSTELAFGVVRLRVGGERPWNEVVASSIDAKTDQPEVELVAVRELARFPDNTTLPAVIDGEAAYPQAFTAGNAAATAAIHAKLGEQLEGTGHKDVFVFVHGVSNDFDDPIYRLAQLWFYLGRTGVPVAYTWPANLNNRSPFEYTYARESSEFTANHLRQFLEAVAAHPEVHKIHIIAHSRGTGITLSVLRDFRLIYRDDPARGREQTKFGNIVLAAPDIDLGVATQLYTVDRVSDLIDRVTIYTYPKDTMLGLSQFLFGGLLRLGTVSAEDSETSRLTRSGRESNRVDVVEVTTRTQRGLGSFGHTYWIDDPETLSDIILVLRDDVPPGAETGRPLKLSERGIWELYDGYPGSEPVDAEPKPMPPHPSPRRR